MLRSRWQVSEEILCCMGLVHDDDNDDDDDDDDSDYDDDEGNWWHCMRVMFLFFIFGLWTWENTVSPSASTALSGRIICE